MEAINYELEDRQKDLSVLKNLYTEKDKEYDKLTERVNSIRKQADTLYEQEK